MTVAELLHSHSHGSLILPLAHASLLHLTLLVSFHFNLFQCDFQCMNSVYITMWNNFVWGIFSSSSVLIFFFFLVVIIHKLFVIIMQCTINPVIFHHGCCQYSISYIYFKLHSLSLLLHVCSLLLYLYIHVQLFLCMFCFLHMNTQGLFVSYTVLVFLR